MFYRIIRRIRRARRKPRRRNSANKKDYLACKEMARVLVMERLEFFKGEYGRLGPEYVEAMKHGRIAIRNQRSRWGSCSSKKNLNFNYRILDLSAELQDYIVVHELCHLKELNHSKKFWDLMMLIIPRALEFHGQARKMKLD